MRRFSLPTGFKIGVRLIPRIFLIATFQFVITIYPFKLHSNTSPPSEAPLGRWALPNRFSYEAAPPGRAELWAVLTKTLDH